LIDGFMLTNRKHVTIVLLCLFFEDDRKSNAGP
jgi:hypothetical protein